MKLLGIALTVPLASGILACVDTGESPTLAGVEKALGAGPQGCYDPAAYGATASDPNDQDDRNGIQDAIDDAMAAAAAEGQATVCLGAGRFIISSRPDDPDAPPPYDRFSFLAVHGNNIAIVGQGEGTVLAVQGDATGLSVLTVNPGSANISITGLTIDTAGSYTTLDAQGNGDEQNHAVRIGNSSCGTGGICGEIQGVVLRDLRFNHPLPPFPHKRGDCIRIHGITPIAPVRGVIVENGYFNHCARSGINAHDSVIGLTISSNVFESSVDQSIDLEPSTVGVFDLAITSNVFRDSDSAVQGDWAVGIGGVYEVRTENGVAVVTDSPTERVVVSGNTFIGRGLQLTQVRDVVVSGNTFASQMDSGYGVISIQGRADNVTLTGNAIRRTGVAGPGVQVLALGNDLTRRATRPTISSNTIEQNTVGSGIQLLGAVDTLVHRNVIRAGGVGDIGILFQSNQAGGNIADVAISDNVVSGLTAPTGIAIKLYANPASIGRVHLSGNLANGAATGLSCTGAISSILSVANSIGPRSCTATFATGD
jgi:hypothetical protein